MKWTPVSAIAMWANKMFVYLKLNKPLLNYYCKEWQHVCKKTQIDSQKSTKGSKPENDS